MLFNEPKLLKWRAILAGTPKGRGFSALQRAEIAEIVMLKSFGCGFICFSALQRAEIAEIVSFDRESKRIGGVSVLFNEPKLLKSR